MSFLTTAKVTWFDDGCCDVKYLDEWDRVPPSYRPGQAVDDSWYTDQYELKLGRDTSGKLFQIAAEQLMAYRFYPEDILHHVSDFGLNERWPHPGDRIVQRLHIFTLAGKPIVDVISMNQIESVCEEPRRVGFRYVTVETHVEQGEWSAYVTWNAQDDVALTVHSISRPAPEEPARNHKFIRARQKEGHQRGLAYFQKTVLDAFASTPQ
ncbi:MAG: DUF1990 family protein [Chloroflexi bacterium]|nr:DUF1990 family protein [Chloroflexota bacterium]